MTIPDERYRSISQARDLLTDITRRRITDLDELCRQAEIVLHHYPDSYTLDLIVMSLNPVRPENAVCANLLWPPPESGSRL